MKRFVQNSFLLILLLGCASTSEKPRTLEEIKREVRKEVQRACEKEIFWGRMPNYPLTDTRTYNWWVKVGGKGPSPDQWCQEYARVRVR